MEKPEDGDVVQIKTPISEKNVGVLQQESLTDADPFQVETPEELGNYKPSESFTKLIQQLIPAPFDKPEQTNLKNGIELIKEDKLDDTKPDIYTAKLKLDKYFTIEVSRISVVHSSGKFELKAVIPGEEIKIRVIGELPDYFANFKKQNPDISDNELAKHYLETGYLQEIPLGNFTTPEQQLFAIAMNSLLNQQFIRTSLEEKGYPKAVIEGRVKELSRFVIEKEQKRLDKANYESEQKKLPNLFETMLNKAISINPPKISVLAKLPGLRNIFSSEVPIEYTLENPVAFLKSKHILVLTPQKVDGVVTIKKQSVAPLMGPFGNYKVGDIIIKSADRDLITRPYIDFSNIDSIQFTPETPEELRRLVDSKNLSIVTVVKQFLGQRQVDLSEVQNAGGITQFIKKELESEVRERENLLHSFDKPNQESFKTRIQTEIAELSKLIIDIDTVHKTDRFTISPDFIKFRLVDSQEVNQK